MLLEWYDESSLVEEEVRHQVFKPILSFDESCPSFSDEESCLSQLFSPQGWEEVQEVQEDSLSQHHRHLTLSREQYELNNFTLSREQ